MEFAFTSLMHRMLCHPPSFSSTMDFLYHATQFIVSSLCRQKTPLHQSFQLET